MQTEYYIHPINIPGNLAPEIMYINTDDDCTSRTSNIANVVIAVNGLLAITGYICGSTMTALCLILTGVFRPKPNEKLSDAILITQIVALVLMSYGVIAFGIGCLSRAMIRSRNRTLSSDSIN